MLRTCSLFLLLLPTVLVGQRSLYPTDYPFAPPTVEWNFFADVLVTPTGTPDTFNWLIPVRVFPSGNYTFQGLIHRRMAVEAPSLDTLWQDSATARTHHLTYSGFTDYFYVHQDTSGNLWLYDSLADRHRLWVMLDTTFGLPRDVVNLADYEVDTLIPWGLDTANYTTEAVCRYDTTQRQCEFYFVPLAYSVMQNLNSENPFYDSYNNSPIGPSEGVIHYPDLSMYAGHGHGGSDYHLFEELIFEMLSDSDLFFGVEEVLVCNYTDIKDNWLKLFDIKKRTWGNAEISIFEEVNYPFHDGNCSLFWISNGEFPVGYRCKYGGEYPDCVIPRRPDSRVETENLQCFVRQSGINALLSMSSPDCNLNVSTHIYSLTGQQVLETSFQDQTQLDLSHLSQGLYYLKIPQTGQVEKLLVQEGGVQVVTPR